MAALSGTALSGKIVEIQGSGFAAQLVMAAKAMTAPLTIRGAAGNLVPGLKFTAIQKLTVRGVNLQMPGWPATDGGCLEFFGANADIKLDGVSFRHGYGAGRIDLTPAVIDAAPEILRIDNLITATSARIAVARIPADGPGWWIGFFNRGANAVQVKGGDGSVVASSADAQVAAGGYLLRTVMSRCWRSRAPRCAMRGPRWGQAVSSPMPSTATVAPRSRIWRS